MPSSRYRGLFLSLSCLLPLLGLAGGLRPLWAEENPRAEDSWVLHHEALFPRDRLLEIEIEMADDDWNAVRAQTRSLALALRKPQAPSPFTYFRGNISIDGHRIQSVGIRKKGFVGSLDQQYPSLKVKFAEYLDQAPIQGLDRLTLNNNKQDPTVIGQYLAYRFFAAAGLPAPRCSFARVRVNGEYLGIYSHVESVKKPFLKRTFGDDGGKLYEGTLADFYVDKVSDFEAKTKHSENREELTALAQVLAGSEDVTSDQLEEYLAVDQFLRYWAVESLLNFWDGYTGNQNNYYVYLNPGDNRFHFIPWGADATFLRFEFVKSKRESVHGASVLANRLYHSSAFADRYQQVLNRLLATCWNEHELLAEIGRLEALVVPHLHDRQRGMPRALGRMRKFVNTRRNEMTYDFERWPVHMEEQPRRPAFTKSVGSARGSFSASLDEPPQDVYEAGRAKIEMTLDGEPVQFSRLGVYVETKKGKGGSRNIVFVGKRKSNGIRVKLLLGMSEARFQSAKPGLPVVVQGNLEEGGFGLFGILSTQGVRLAGGTVEITRFASEPAAALEGTFEVDVVRFEDN